MNKIQKISSYVLAILNSLVIALPLLYIIMWTFIDSTILKNLSGQGRLLLDLVHTPEGYVDLSTINWTFLSKAIGFSSQIVGLLPFFLSLLVLRSLFKNYKNGILFNATNAVYYKYLGLLFFFDALITKPVSSMLMVLAATIGNPPGHRYISLSIGTPNIEALFYGAIILVISWVMLQASELHDEQKLTI